MFLDLWVVVKTAWVVVKVAEWWLGLTTSDQHGQNLYIIDIHCWGIRATLTDGRHSQSSVVIGHNELFILKIQCTTYYVSSHTHTHTHTHTRFVDILSMFKASIHQPYSVRLCCHGDQSAPSSQVHSVTWLMYTTALHGNMCHIPAHSSAFPWLA